MKVLIATKKKGKIEKSHSIDRFSLRETTRHSEVLQPIIAMVQSSPRLVTYKYQNSESSTCSYNCESDTALSSRGVKIEEFVESKEEESSGSMGHLPPEVGYHANGKPTQYEYEYYYSDD